MIEMLTVFGIVGNGDQLVKTLV